MIVLFNYKYHYSLQGGFQGTFILTPADSPFQLSQTGILTVRNSTLLDRERVPSIHLQVLKISLLLSRATRGKQVIPDLSCQEADWYRSAAYLKNQIQSYLEGNTTSDAVYTACNCRSSYLLLLEHAFEQSSNFTASFLKVTARDHLSPYHEVHSAINILLQDENDNSPTFRGTPYEQDLFINMTAGMSILQVLDVLSKNDIFMSWMYT